MSVENVQKFFELVKSNEELAQEIEKIKNEAQNKAGTVNYEQIISENVIPMAKKHGLEFTLEDFLKYSSSIAPQGELSDDDLLNVSGGWSGSQMLATGLMLLTLGSSGLSMMGNIQGPGGSSNDGGQGMASAPTSYSMSIDNTDKAPEDAIHQEVEQEILNNIEKSNEEVSNEADEVVENNAEKINTAEEDNESTEDVSSNKEENVTTKAQKDATEATEKEAANGAAEEDDGIEMTEEEIDLGVETDEEENAENNEEATNEATEEKDEEENIENTEENENKDNDNNDIKEFDNFDNEAQILNFDENDNDDFNEDREEIELGEENDEEENAENTDEAIEEVNLDAENNEEATNEADDDEDDEDEDDDYKNAEGDNSFKLYDFLNKDEDDDEDEKLNDDEVFDLFGAEENDEGENAENTEEATNEAYAGNNEEIAKAKYESWEKTADKSNKLSKTLVNFINANNIKSLDDVEEGDSRENFKNDVLKLKGDLTKSKKYGSYNLGRGNTVEKAGENGPYSVMYNIINPS